MNDQLIEVSEDGKGYFYLDLKIGVLGQGNIFKGGINSTRGYSFVACYKAAILDWQVIAKNMNQ